MASDSVNSMGAATGGSGAPALEGYLYQVDVSVWTALDLVLAKKLANAVELEPCSQEDIEAHLPETDPGKVVLGSAVGQRLLVIQAKLRTGEPWNVSAITALLKHGGTNRVSAKDRLENPTVHYLLVTSAPLTGVARGLRVRNFGQWPDPNEMPASLVSELHPGAAGRVAVLANEESERIEQRIKDLLLDAFRVPHSKWSSCLEALREQARIKMTGRAARHWMRAELEETIKSFDGYFASSPELSHYVPPTNWSILCEQLQQKYAVVIAGRSGTGKTMAAEALWDHVRGQVPGIERIHIRTGPSEVRAVQRSGPVLFDIEDPWGRYRFVPGSEEWNDKLPSILRSAGPGRLFVITTREDVLCDAQARKATSPWRVSLEAEHYKRAERQRLYENRVLALPRDLQLLAVDNREWVLRELETPLEIQKFFDALAIGSDGDAELGSERVKQAIQDAHHDSIESTIVTQINHRSATHWAAVIWGLLKANAKLSRALMPEIQDRLVEHGDIYEQGFEELVNFLIAGRSLRQVDSAVSYYHPRVENGLECALLAKRIPATRVLQQLCDVLLSFDEGEEDDWGRHAVAQLVSAALSLDKLRFRCSQTVQANLDAWLSSRLARADDQFEDYLRLARRVGSERCMPAELARFLMDKAPQVWFPRASSTPLEESDEWYAQVSGDPVARSVCDTFVRRIMPYGQSKYPNDISTHLVRLAGGMTDAFLDAALSIVTHDVNSNDDAIVNGALVDLDAFAPVVEAALEYLESLEGDSNKWHETALKIRNGEYSEDYAEHLCDSASEEGYTANELLKTYVSHFRHERGWHALREHPHIMRLLRWWLGVIQRECEDHPPDASEIDELGGMAFNTAYEAELWALLALHWQPVFENSLLQRVANGHQDAELRAQAVACLVLHAPQQFQFIRDKLIAENNIARLLGFFEDLGRASNMRSYRAAGFWDIASTWAMSLERPYSEIVAPFTLQEADRSWDLTAQGVELVCKLAPSDEYGLLTKIRFGAANGIAVDTEIQDLLATTLDEDIAAAAIDAAIIMHRSEIVEGGLLHPLAKVRARALQAIGSWASDPLPAHILAMAEDKGKYVREALVQVLANRPKSEYVDTLIVLADDRWSKWSGNPESDANYPIARAAAECLIKVPGLSQHVVGSILELAKSCVDPEVRSTLFCALAHNAPPSARDELLQLAVSPGRREIRDDAAYALLNADNLLEDDLVAEIEPEHLVRNPEYVAAVLTLIVGLRGTESAVDEAAARLASVSSRRVFLILLGVALAQRTENMSHVILDLLPADHVATALIAGCVDGLLPRAALDDLGDVRAVRQVLWFLSEQFEPSVPA